MPKVVEYPYLPSFASIEQLQNFLMHREALQHRCHIRKLTIEDVKGENDLGWETLLKWIQDIENYSHSDSMLLHLVKLTLSEDLLILLNLDLVNSSWKDIRAMLFDLVPKGNVDQTVLNIIKNKMTEEDNVTSFMLKIRRKYKQACELHGVNNLPVSLERVLAFCITGNMNDTGRAIYLEQIMQDPKATVTKMEKTFYNKKDFKHSLFPQKNHEAISPHFRPKYKRRTRRYNNSNCWFHTQDLCRYGHSCWYRHGDSVNKEAVNAEPEFDIIETPQSDTDRTDIDNESHSFEDDQTTTETSWYTK